MKYDLYITKKRMRVRAACGLQVNIPWGTILPVDGDFIVYKDNRLCAVKSQNAKDYFWGYDQDNPQAEIERQEAAAALMETAPKDSGDALASPFSPWRKYGHLEQIPGGWLWVWDDAVEDLPKCQLERLLACAKSGAVPQEVRMRGDRRERVCGIV